MREFRHFAKTFPGDVARCGEEIQLLIQTQGAEMREKCRAVMERAHVSLENAELLRTRDAAAIDRCTFFQNLFRPRRCTQLMRYPFVKNIIEYDAHTC